MEQNKICPNCGRPVKSDSTYCRNCGFTLGIKCPKCAAILPVGTKKCPECSAFLIKKENPLSDTFKAFKKNFRIICAVLQILLLIFTVTTLFFSFIKFTYTDGDGAVQSIDIKAYQTISYLFGGTNSLTDALREAADGNGLLWLSELSLNLSGICYLISAISALISVVLIFANIKRMYKKTAEKLLAADAVIFACSTFSYAFYKLAVGKIIFPYILPAADLPYRSSTWTLSLSIISLIPLLFIILVRTVILRYVKSNSNDEISLADITVKPLKSLISKIRLPESKKEKRSGSKEYSSFEFTPAFSKYLILVAASLVFTQALRNSASHIFFLFVLALPVFLFLYILTAKLTLYASILSESKTTEKYKPCKYEFTLNNSSPFAYPFIDAVISLPLSSSVRCEDNTVKISMAPFSRYNINNSVSFRYRGTYEIGIKYLYVYDFLKIMRIRVNISSTNTFYVMPRRLNFENPETSAVSDSASKTLKSNITYDKLEISDIREYRAGDSLKSIHWKLSSKSDDFVVKDFNTGTSNTTLIYCDLSNHFENNSKNESENSKKPKNHTDKSKPHRDKIRENGKSEAVKEVKNEEFIREISDSELKQKLEQQMRKAERLNKKTKRVADSPAENAALDAPSFDMPTDLKAIELSDPAYSEDINEFLADGTVELTIAAVIRELRKGRYVVLSWFDNRSESGIYSYTLAGEDSFEAIYKLFATAPLCDGALSADKLCIMTEDIPSSGKIFVVPSIDNRTVTSLCNLPGISDSDTFGASEVIFYNPNERFKNISDRRLYIESCRRQLSENGILLTEGYLPLAVTANYGGESE